MTLRVTHVHDERVTVHHGAVELMAYVYRPDPVAFESRKPYVHPLRTLAGHLVTGYRPNDHRWHKGLQMTASHLSGQNFWGGNSYLGPEQGYQEVPERIGSMRHDAFHGPRVSPERCHLTEDLTWIEHGGQPWATERRGVTVHAVDTDSGSWALDWSIHLTNVRGQPLVFGSPTTAGREMAGYTGLQWRGPRDFTGGTVFAPGTGYLRGGEAAELMGTPAVEAPWLAFTAAHDEVDAHSTLVFAHAPENLQPRGAPHPSHWFVRAEPFPTVAFSWAFFEEFALAPGASFAYRYRLLVADGAWDRDQVGARLSALPW